MLVISKVQFACLFFSVASQKYGTSLIVEGRPTRETVLADSKTHIECIYGIRDWEQLETHPIGNEAIRLWIYSVRHLGRTDSTEHSDFKLQAS